MNSIAEERVIDTKELKEEFGLEDREVAFVLHYVANPMSAGRSAKAAGYSPKCANVVGGELINKPSVAAAIASCMNRLAERTKVTIDRVMHELAIIGFSDISAFYVDDKGELQLRPGVPDYARRAVKSIKRKVTKKTDEAGNEYEWVEVEIHLWGKTEALKLAGQHLGMYRENINVKHSGKVEHEHKQVWEFGGRKLTFS